MPLRQAAHDREAESEPAFGTVDRLAALDEQVEDAWQDVSRNADPVVANAYDRLAVL